MGRAGNEQDDGVGKIATKAVNLDNFEKEGDVVGKHNDQRKKWR